MLWGALFGENQYKMRNSLNITWTEFKALITDKNLPVGYTTQDSGSYSVYTTDGAVIYQTLIIESADKTDFENNYQTNANKEMFSRSKLVGDDEQNAVKVTDLKEASVSDVLNNGGSDAVLTIGTSPVELKAGASRKTDRKLLIFMALDNNFTFGFSSLTQSIPLYKSQVVILHVGKDTEVWAVNTESGKSMAVGEL